MHCAQFGCHLGWHWNGGSGGWSATLCFPVDSDLFIFFCHGGGQPLLSGERPSYPYPDTASDSPGWHVARRFFSGHHVFCEDCRGGHCYSVSNGRRGRHHSSYTRVGTPGAAFVAFGGRGNHAAVLGGAASNQIGRASRGEKG